MSFPQNRVSGAFGFTAQPLVEVQDPVVREASVVKF